MKTLNMILMTIFLTAGTVYGQTNDPPPPVPSQEQPEVETRGPVNEAFAQPVTTDEHSGFIVPKAPPPDIEETPPAERPVGDQFAWIPGYWAWDSDRNEHIWVSGCWRAVPPGKYWVPGYWARMENGWRWVEGFWAPVSEKEIEYLPQPPAVTYVEPPEESPDMIWVPSCWYWSRGHYTLRAGYWIPARADWVWVPSHYIWTPRGYVFSLGHWDYPLRRRGVLFAPVYFPGNIYSGVRFSYSLSIALDLGNLEFGLFTRPGYGHYYFGDYYDSFYIGIGIFPWFECMTRHTWYDPIYMHDRWRHRKTEPNWWQHERREYERRRSDRNLRPPRTYREMEHRVSRMTESQRRNFEVAAPMNRIIERKTTSFRFRQDRPKARMEIRKQARDVQNYVKERSKWESPVNVRNARPSGERYPSPKYREMRSPVNRNERDLKPSEKREYSRPDHVRSGEPERGRQQTVIQKKYSNESRPEKVQTESDNVKVPASPVVDKKRRGVLKRTPSQPAEERVKKEKKEDRDSRYRLK